MTYLDTFAAFLRARFLALFSFLAPLPPLPVTGLDREMETTLRSLRKRYRRDRALFQRGLALHRQGKSLAQLNAMFDAVTHYDWDIWAGPCDVSTLEERIERERVLIALLLRECRPALERHPSLLTWILSDEA
ncbi:hypothetical protein [Bordetella sp. LUAb4]|uniref:hypothetical protein n=1 Tax=Bordetella sp. LUAb4 TaxID=2843195 RepID=UPI001E4E1434|nr:hypothetical protein [Bordetella sp. LUAb4]